MGIFDFFKIRHNQKSNNDLDEKSTAPKTENNSLKSQPKIVNPQPAASSNNALQKPNSVPTADLAFGLNIPNDIISLLWIKGGPLSNYTPDNKSSFNLGGINFSVLNQNEPSLIDVALPYDSDVTSDEYLEDIGYYPSYANLTPKQRYIYLSWLQDITKPVATGYVFIFYYGLERHLMFGKYREAIDIIKRLQKYHRNGSFLSYSSDAMLISILKNNELNLMCSIDIGNTSNSTYGLVKGFLYGQYSVEDIIRLHKEFGFTNNRYIKNQYTDFYNAVKYVLIEKYKSDFFPLPKNAFKECKGNITLVVANYSLMAQDRFAYAPDITTNNDVKNSIYEILVTAHEKVKADNRKRQKTKSSVLNTIDGKRESR